MAFLADLFYLGTGLAYLPFALFNAVFRNKNRSGWGQRLGLLPLFPPVGRRIWVHAVSLGEVNATPRLVDQLLQQVPDAQVVVSTTTDTGYRRAVQLYGAERVFRFPLDFSWIARRVLHIVRPVMIVLVELEVWPNLVCQAARQGIRVVVINGRLTQRSARRMARLGRP